MRGTHTPVSVLVRVLDKLSGVGGEELVAHGTVLTKLGSECHEHDVFFHPAPVPTQRLRTITAQPR